VSFFHQSLLPTILLQLRTFWKEFGCFLHLLLLDLAHFGWIARAAGERRGDNSRRGSSWSVRVILVDQGHSKLSLGAV
jgi:hypothetical protein